MRTTDFRRLDVGESVRLEFAIADAIDCAGKTNPWIACGFEPVDIGARVRRITDNQKFLFRANFLECLDHHVRVVLGLEPAHVKEILQWLNSELSQRSGCLQALAMRAI